jgi:hypothetical protein
VFQVDVARGSFWLYVRFANSGPEAVGPFDVLFTVYVDPSDEPARVVARMPGLAEAAHSIAYAHFLVPNLVAGTYHAEAVLDSENRVQEVDEANNLTSKEIDLTSK